ncbi:TIGR03862 family flavoprotein [Pseudoxanthomonas taiwanensis]|uniref:Aminoacetone oxidase family FAD-binding enzyme n=1 Tax=Pseudoxanthomonas taiwanensis TaxID=176598 RepID=A0A921TGI6_9GAMM|nr:TIGR03862 family flavoprotein [Pseudoxanthomonas taiwanensis]KAF1689959.1 aminoacetone oxidase family FAD-binding enzyme [Pseudoxanthomonas taiwanensis]
MQEAPSPVRLPGLAIVGGGPAGLMAAEVARAAGCEVELFEAKGSVGRKFLIAGKGGLNLTHAEPLPDFIGRYGARADAVVAWLHGFGPEALRDWARGLGVDTYVGSSRRVFPLDRKAAPLLRGWVRRLKEQGVRFHVQHRWLGWDEAGALRFATPAGERSLHAGATVLALGGGSWPQLGSDGAWVPVLRERGVDVAPLVPGNCGFDIGWSAHFAERHAGAPLKPGVAHWRDAEGREQALQGECVATATGIEGSLVYALSVPLREAIAHDGQATLWLDLVPGRDLDRLRRDLARPRNGRSLSEHLRRHAGVGGVKAALLRGVLDAAALADMVRVAATLKRLPLVLRRPRPIEEAISSGGGVRLEAMDTDLMLSTVPGVFCAGEMLDWEAPTGGYLLTACFASGRRAGLAAARWLQRR